jgi:hypothetical protein
MKTWNCQVRSKEEMTTDLMFEEIMRLRNEAANLATHLHNVCEAANECETITNHLKSRVKAAEEYRQNMDK